MSHHFMLKKNKTNHLVQLIMRLSEHAGATITVFRPMERIMYLTTHLMIHSKDGLTALIRHFTVTFMFHHL